MLQRQVNDIFIISVSDIYLRLQSSTYHLVPFFTLNGNTAIKRFCSIPIFSTFQETFVYASSLTYIIICQPDSKGTESNCNICMG